MNARLSTRDALTLSVALPKATPDIYSDPLVVALTNRMIADPKLAYEAVTGACAWPPANDESLDDLACQAANKADELVSHRDDLGEPVPSFRIELLRAAEAALVILERDERQERKLAQWADEARIGYRPPVYR